MRGRRLIPGHYQPLCACVDRTYARLEAARPCGSERASGNIIDGPGQAGAIAGRPAHDHWTTRPSSGRMEPTIRRDDRTLVERLQAGALVMKAGPFFSGDGPRGEAGRA